MGAQAEPAAATDGDGFFAAWLDARSRGNTVRGTRVTAGGEVLDPAGIVLSVLTAGTPEVVWTGSDYLVSWRTPANTLVMTRVALDGTVIERERTLVSGAFSGALATNGSNLLAAWLTPSPLLPTLHVRLFTLSGQPAGEETTLPWLGTIRMAGSAAGFLILGLEPRQRSPRCG